MFTPGSTGRARAFRQPRWALAAAAAFLSVFCALAEDSPASLIEQGHFKRAEALLRPSLQKNPNDPQASFLMSKVDLAFRRVDDAVAHAEKAVAADGSKAAYHAQLADAVGSKTGDPNTGMFEKMSLANASARRRKPLCSWIQRMSRPIRTC